MASAARDSREAVDLRNVEGVSAVLTSLAPGVTATFSFGTSAAGDPIHIGGHGVSSSYGSGQVDDASALELSDGTLYPAVAYAAFLSGGEVVVVAAG